MSWILCLYSESRMHFCSHRWGRNAEFGNFPLPTVGSYNSFPPVSEGPPITRSRFEGVLEKMEVGEKSAEEVKLHPHSTRSTSFKKKLTEVI